jgi:hypothetical protein|nr:MAG TPA: hypothetical protein [Caudoviricetes sp.]
MGGRGSYSGVARKAGAARFTTVAQVDARMSELSAIMERTASDATGYPSGVPGATKSGYDEYRTAQSEFQRLQGVRANLLEREAATQRADRSPRTFVNSFGEATSRYITTGTYERTRRRTDADVLRNMGY